MNSLTDEFINQMLTKFDPNPNAVCSREEQFIAFMVCKNLSDLCETGRAILLGLQRVSRNLENLPDSQTIQFCQTVIRRYYSDDMFIEDAEFGNLPNWKVIEKFNKTYRDHTCRIYRIIEKNVLEHKSIDDILTAIRKHDRVFFIENFDGLFARIPLQEQLNLFKNFLSHKDVADEDQDTIWSFFESLLDLFLNKQDIIAGLRDV